MKIDLGEIIATRKLRLKNDLTGDPVVEVLLGRPRKAPKSSDMCVPYAIRYSHVEKSQYAIGIDEFQALQLALGILDAELVAFQRQLGVELVWEGGKEGDLGFGNSHLRVM